MSNLDRVIKITKNFCPPKFGEKKSLFLKKLLYGYSPVSTGLSTDTPERGAQFFKGFIY
jgi:hypothetical protein